MTPSARRGALSAVVFCAFVACAACGHDAAKAAEPDAAVLAQRSGRFERALAEPDSEAGRSGAIARWIMPDELKEISGLALTGDGRLFGHGDEHAHVFEIDYRRGVVVKEFTLAGQGKALKGDFEGMTIVNDTTMYLLASDGKLYEFKEGADRSEVGFTVHDTGLGDECEFEGVAFARSLDALLLACKKVKNKARRDSVVVYRWKLGGTLSAADRLSHFTVPFAQAIGGNGWDGFHPSDITVNPFNGDYVLVASREQAMLEVTPAGRVVFTRSLPGQHDQAEGIAITNDSLLIISDEAAAKAVDTVAHPHRVADDPGQHRPAFVTVYRWR